MIKRQFMQPKDMWARVENGNLLYVPVVTVHGADQAHIYLAGRMARAQNVCAKTRQELGLKVLPAA